MIFSKWSVFLVNTNKERVGSMKEKQETVEKVIEFTQSETMAKQFRRDYPISKKLRVVMLEEVYRDFTEYVLVRNYTLYQSMLKEYIDDHDPMEGKRQGLEHNLFWWKVLYDSSQNAEMSCVEDYIAENYHKLSDRPLIISWLREWDKAIPKFYHIGYKYNDRVLVVTDILAEETVDVIVYDPTAIPPEKGGIVMGTLIPIGDALYFPIIDFYHFDFKVREEIVSNIRFYFDNHLENSTMLEAFIHVLSIVLQVEQQAALEN